MYEYCWYKFLILFYILYIIFYINVRFLLSLNLLYVLMIECFVILFWFKIICIIFFDFGIWEYRFNVELIFFKLLLSWLLNSSLVWYKVKWKNGKIVCILKWCIKYDCKNFIFDMDVIFFLFLRILNEYIDVLFLWLKEVIEFIFNFCF